MYKSIAIFILCFTISLPVLAEDDERVLERLFRFQITIAEQGDSEAMLILGDMYLKGQGTDRDRDIALYWYNQAARAGNKRAHKRIEQLFTQKDTEKQNQATATQELVIINKNKQEDSKRKQDDNKRKQRDEKRKQQDKKALELEKARQKSQQLAAQLARERDDAEKARSEMQRLKDLEQQLAQERAAAEKARKDVEMLKSREQQLIQERKAAEQARIKAEKARMALEQTAQNTEDLTPVLDHKANSTPGAQSSEEPVKASVNSFKSNPCENPQLKDSYSCKLLNRRR